MTREGFEDRKVRISETHIRDLRRRLLAGELTAEEAEQQGFPPAAPIEETR